MLALLEPDAAWNLVGWSRDGVLVACAGIERIDGDELRRPGARLARRSGGCVSPRGDRRRRDRGTDRRPAPTHRPTTSTGLAGFTAEPGRDRLVRVLAEAPAAVKRTRAATLDDLEQAIRAAWSRETSDDPDEWSESNPARGQCAVTALLVRELLGGEILVANVLRDGVRVDRHAWNRLPSGLTLDLTREQFTQEERFGEPAVEEPMLTHRHPERFGTLRELVRSKLGLND